MIAGTFARGHGPAMARVHGQRYVREVVTSRALSSAKGWRTAQRTVAARQKVAPEITRRGVSLLSNR